MSAKATIVLIAMVLGIGGAITASSIVTGPYLSKIASSNETITETYPYCDLPSSVAASSLLPQVESSNAFSQAAGPYSNWVLVASSTENLTSSGLGVANQSVNQLELEFASFSAPLTPSLLCATGSAQRLLFAFVPISLDGSYNMASITAYSQAPYTP